MPSEAAAWQESSAVPVLPARKVRGGYRCLDSISHNDRLLRHRDFRLKFQLFKIRNGDGAFLCFAVVIVVSPPVGQAVGAGS